MSSANVNSTRALAEAKAALDWFAREAAGALGESDSELQRTLGWLQREALPHWERQIKQREQEVQSARSEFYRQQLIANPNTPSALRERKAWDRAKLRVEEARARAKAVRRWLIQWERESALYKGQVAPLNEALMHDLPAATARLQRLLEVLEQYATLRAPEAGEASAAVLPGPLTLGDVQADPISAALPDAFAILRRQTPRPAVRDSAPLVEPALVAAAPSGVLRRADLEALERLALPRAIPDHAARVVLRSGALAAPMYYLERTPSGRADDSGWYIASAGAAMGIELQALPVWALLLRRPDLEPVLALPAGFLLAVADGRVQALLDERDVDLWQGEESA